MTYDERYKSYLAIIEPALKKYFGARRGFEFDGLLDAMDYSLTAGGKRIRPVLVLEFARLNGLEPEKALPAACAVEMLHTYSLIHDDLPCMDNDDLRRGKPTNHKVFGESTAVLAGDALQAEAFGAILRSALPVEARARCAEILAGAAGVDGICGGQFMDLSAEGHALSAEELSALQGRKTGALLSADCMLGAVAAGADETAIDLASQYGAQLGAAFQIRDDMLDVLSTVGELGKPIGSDKRDGKTTFMSLYGEERCARMVEKITALACSTVAGMDADGFLTALAKKMASRRG